MSSIDIKEISKMSWIQRWAGSYTFISPAYWGYQYYHSLESILGVHFDHTLFIHRKGTVAFYVRRDEFENLGKFLADKAVKNPALMREWLDELKKNTDAIVSIMDSLANRIPSWEEYQEFLHSFERHLAYHVFMKKTVDFLPLEKLDEMLPAFKDARLYSERVYSDTERFFRNIARFVAKEEGRNADNLTCLTQKEFEEYLKTGQLPSEDTLAERFTASVLYFVNGEMNLLLGESVDELEKLMAAERIKNISEIKGVVGYRGVAEGVCRIILDPFKAGEFSEGDILVTGMTRPEFMPFMQKAAAIVTDAGGILSHAAITARELRRPCIVGTEIATKAFKDGDELEVNADKGIVKKLNI